MFVVYSSIVSESPTKIYACIFNLLYKTMINGLIMDNVSNIKPFTYYCD
jgi:hypothetical protein